MTLGISVEDGIVLFLETLGYIFHSTMAFFIGWQIFHKVRIFYSAFFILFLTISTADILYFLSCSVINIKLPQFGLWTDFFVYTSEGWISTIGYYIGEYCGIYQAFAHFIISLNRFNVFYFPQTYNKNWNGRRFYIVLFSLFLIPFLCMSWHLNHKILYYYVTPTSIVQAVDDKSIQLAISIMGLTIFGVTSIFELGIGIATLIKYNRLNNTGQISAKQRAAVILFLYSLCLTAAQFLRTIFHASIIIAMLTSNLALASYMQKRLPLIADIYAFGSIFLFLLSKKVQSAYLKFYRNRICFKKFNRISFSPFTHKITKIATISQKDVIF